MADDKPKLTRRRALGGLATIGAAGVLGSTTYAAFQDEETITTTLSAAKLDLSVNWFKDTGDTGVQSGTVEGEKGNASKTLAFDQLTTGSSGVVAFKPQIDGTAAFLYVGTNTFSVNSDLASEIDVTAKLVPGNQLNVGGEGTDLSYDASKEGHDLQVPTDIPLSALVKGGQGIDGLRQGWLMHGEKTGDVYNKGETGSGLVIEWNVPTSNVNNIEGDNASVKIEFVAQQYTGQTGNELRDPSVNPFK